MFLTAFLLARNKDHWIQNSAVSNKITCKKGLLSKIFFNVLTTKHCASFLNFFISSMVIVSHLLSLLNKPWTLKPSSTLFMGSRFSFSSKLISVTCSAVLNFSNTSGVSQSVEDLISGAYTWMQPLAFHTNTSLSMVQQWST